MIKCNYHIILHTIMLNVDDTLLCYSCSIAAPNTLAYVAGCFMMIGDDIYGGRDSVSSQHSFNSYCSHRIHCVTESSVEIDLQLHNNINSVINIDLFKLMHTNVLRVFIFCIFSGDKIQIFIQ